MALVVGILTVLSMTSMASAQLTRNSRTESVQTQKTDTVSDQKKEEPERPVDQPKIIEPETIPKPIAPEQLKDPNGCEAKGMWYRADNNECIDKNVTPASRSVTPVTKTLLTGSGDCSLVNGYDWPVETATRVCMQESGGNPNAANWSDNHMSWAGCMGSFGLMQINCYHGQLFDGASNIATAYSMWKSSGGTFAKHWPNTCAKVGC